LLRLFVSDFLDSGHLPKNGELPRLFRLLPLSQRSVVSARLAPLLDGNRVTVEGTMRQSNSKDRSSSLPAFHSNSRSVGWREHWALRM